MSELDGNISLYDPARNDVHVLNETASEIWRLLDGTRGLDDIVERIASLHSVDPEQVRPHVAETVSTFLQRELISSSLHR